MQNLKKYKLNQIGYLTAILIVGLLFLFFACDSTKNNPKTNKKVNSAANLLGNPSYRAISYGGYRAMSRDTQPTLNELKEDMHIMSAMGVKFIRTYNVTRPHAANVLKAINEIKSEDPDFEMYVMLGAWIDCKNAWTDKEPNHDIESEANAAEIQRAVNLANNYPDIVKVIAVGNEAMVKWATSYYVQPDVILKWVNHLQNLKNRGELDKSLWITSSDNFASWGGGEEQYHVPALNELIKSVDFISMHTYPMHDTHYNPDFWNNTEGDLTNDEKQIEEAMLRAKKYAQYQYYAVKKYMQSLGVDKPIHIGETGWASVSNGFYGPSGSKACDEYKQALYHSHMREWTDNAGLSCFYFQAFDEPWKDDQSPNGSENHFGLITVEGKAKYAIWNLVDKGLFDGLSRGGNPITKTFGGNKSKMMETVFNPAEIEMKPMDK